MSTGRYLYLASQSSVIRLPASDSILEARFLDCIQGKIRNRELFETFKLSGNFRLQL